MLNEWFARVAHHWLQIVPIGVARPQYTRIRVHIARPRLINELVAENVLLARKSDAHIAPKVDEVRLHVRVIIVQLLERFAHGIAQVKEAERVSRAAAFNVMIRRIHCVPRWVIYWRWKFDF